MFQPRSVTGWVFVVMLAALCSLACIDAYDCEHRPGESSRDCVSPEPSAIVGRVSYIADWHNYYEIDGQSAGHPITASTRRGRIPARGEVVGLRYLWICAYARNGAVDFATAERDDLLLGCTRADAEGHYHIEVQREAPGRDIYLVSNFCDGPLIETAVPGTQQRYTLLAEVCVWPNAVPTVPMHDLREGQGGDPTSKFIWSRSYPDPLIPGQDTHLSWNLSCPDHDGRHADPASDLLDCRGATVEPREDARTTDSNESGRNSNHGFNKAATHMFAAAVEVLAQHGSLRPTPTTIFTDGQGQVGVLCSAQACRTDPLFMIIRDARVREANGRWYPPIVDPEGGAEQVGFDVVAIPQACDSSSEQGSCTTLNPWVLTHEIGHAIHSRWMNHVEKLGPSGGDRAWTAQAYATFVAMATWFAPDDPDVYAYRPQLRSGEQRDVPGSWTDGACGPGTACTCEPGTMTKGTHEIQFFWDLYDRMDDDGLDQVSLSFADIRNVWGLFPPGDDDGAADECGHDEPSHGRNLDDWRRHYESVATRMGWPDISALMWLNCADHHVAGLGCEP